jgi:hypothetical protein
MHIDLNHYYRSVGILGNLHLAAMANLSLHVHVSSVVLVVPTLIHLLNVVFFVLRLAVETMAMVQLMIDLNETLNSLVVFQWIVFAWMQIEYNHNPLINISVFSLNMKKNRINCCLTLKFCSVSDFTVN